MLQAIFHYQFLQNAFIGAILASIACGIIGTIIIEKKMVMISGGIAHTAFGGIGVGYFFGIEPMIGAIVFSVLAALGISSINKKASTNTDVIIGIFWAVGMALGLLLVSLVSGYVPDMSSYLFGDILAISRSDIITIFFADILIILGTVLCFNCLKAYMFDEEFVSVTKVNVKFLEYMLYVLTAITIVGLIKIVGIILVLALLTIPSATAKFFTYDLKKIMIISSILGMVFCFIGLWISYQANVASGASIIICGGITYGVEVVVANYLRRKTQVREE